jgi:hypothetical protein
VQASHAKFPVSLGHEQRDRLPNDLFGAVAEYVSCTTIKPLDYPVGRYGHDRVKRRVQNGAVACLALS